MADNPMQNVTPVITDLPSAEFDEYNECSNYIEVCSGLTLILGDKDTLPCVHVDVKVFRGDESAIDAALFEHGVKIDPEDYGQPVDIAVVEFLCEPI